MDSTHPLPVFTKTEKSRLSPRLRARAAPSAWVLRAVEALQVNPCWTAPERGASDPPAVQGTSAAVCSCRLREGFNRDPVATLAPCHLQLENYNANAEK